METWRAASLALSKADELQAPQLNNDITKPRFNQIWISSVSGQIKSNDASGWQPTRPTIPECQFWTKLKDQHFSQMAPLKTQFIKEQHKVHSLVPRIIGKMSSQLRTFMWMLEYQLRNVAAQLAHFVLMHTETWMRVNVWFTVKNILMIHTLHISFSGSRVI